MRGREPIMPQRLRRIPRQFSWVDHRLVSDGHVRGRSAPALALYLFLVTVADAEGLSWYSDGALCRGLSWRHTELQDARLELERACLIAYREPLYQVLDLAPQAASLTRRRESGARHPEPLSARDILQSILTPGGAR